MTTNNTCPVFVTRRRSVGIMAKGTESFKPVHGPCGRKPLEGHELCPRHEAEAIKIAAANAARRAAK